MTLNSSYIYNKCYNLCNTYFYALMHNAQVNNRTILCCMIAKCQQAAISGTIAYSGTI